MDDALLSENGAEDKMQGTWFEAMRDRLIAAWAVLMGRAYAGYQLPEAGDFLGLGMIIKEQRSQIDRLQVENKLLFDNLKGDDADLERFNRTLRRALGQG